MASGQTGWVQIKSKYNYFNQSGCFDSQRWHIHHFHPYANGWLDQNNPSGLFDPMKWSTIGACVGIFGTYQTSMVYTTWAYQYCGHANLPTTEPDEKHTWSYINVLLLKQVYTTSHPCTSTMPRQREVSFIGAKDPVGVCKMDHPSVMVVRVLDLIHTREEKYEGRNIWEGKDGPNGKVKLTGKYLWQKLFVLLQ